MVILPNEIQDKIWKIYYSKLYKDNMSLLEKTIKRIYYFNDNIENIKKQMRIIRFSNNSEEILYTKNDLKKNLRFYNQNIKNIIYNKPDNIICKENQIFCYIIQLVKFQDYYTDINKDYKLIIAYFNKYNNFQENIINRLKNIIK